ncbi:AAA family ATPase [Paraburkholderia sp. MMS20-SJTN17]|uniref:AAA family ATPase n=1 Tax=Paraburkholderia translucens TaxID=2886945 RepID=A0ABS8KB84_9BURK|nr:AAA family ATPase [Paraburkholderia sp. MMS20-SJTN17]MCC8402021.1 AAA family ATPase [Paraburkholderia sp. MMS20-SJTN17]
MGENFEQDYQDWDKFLQEWPLERLRSMSIHDYTKAGSKDSFVYWLEIRLGNLGNISGGSGFKFGVYARANKLEKESGRGLAYSDEFGWYQSFGQTADEAFHKVRSIVVRIAEAAAAGDLDAIDAADLGDVVKWKIAFHYQDRAQPMIVNVFKPLMLRAFLGATEHQKSMPLLYRQVLQRMQPNEGILEFGARVWPRWAKKKIAIWRLSHDPDIFPPSELEVLTRQHVVALPDKAGEKEAERFRKAPNGALFYLCQGHDVRLLGRLDSGVSETAHEIGPLLKRRYEVLSVPHDRGSPDGNSKVWTLRSQSAFQQVPEYKLLEFEEQVLRPYFGLDLEELATLEPMPDDSVASHDATAAQVVDEPRTQGAAGPLNRILFGPPGTGKTYRSVAEAVSIIEGAQVSRLMEPGEYPSTKQRFDSYRADGQIEFVTFHPSYAYQDFVEGIRPQPTAEGGLSYDVDPGVFRRIAERARNNWEASRRSVDATTSDRERFERAYRQLLTDIDESEEGFVKATLFRGNECEVKVGPKERSLTVLVPRQGSPCTLPKHHLYGLWTRRSEIVTPVDVRLSAQSFFWAVLRLMENIDARLGMPPEHKESLARFVLVVDEINRGNIAKTFGELITLIEDDKRLGAANELTARLPYSPDERPFGLPPNLYLVGTMNTADRSIALIDTALRRRFHFIELTPDASVLEELPGCEISLRTLLTVLNDRIEYLFDREHAIGHAYLCGINNFPTLAERLKHKIVPLLQEYFHDDWSKIRMVFNDGGHKASHLHVIREQQTDAELFGASFTGIEQRPRYSVADTITPEMVRSIYE